MISIAHEFAARSEDRLVVFGPYVYAIRRVNTDDLRLVGFAHLEGASAHREAQRQVNAEAKELRQRVQAASKEEIEEVRATARQRMSEMSEKLLDQWLSTPAGAKAWSERCSAYICASVVGMGRLKGWVAADAQEVRSDTDPALLAVPIPGSNPPKYLEPVSFVQQESEEKLGEAKLWVHRLTPAERDELGRTIMGIQSTATVREVLPFRAGSEAAPPASRSGDDVPGRGAPARVAEVPAVGARARRGGTASRSGGAGGEPAPAGPDAGVGREPVTRRRK